MNQNKQEHIAKNDWDNFRLEIVKNLKKYTNN